MQKTREGWVDVIRFVAIFMVIASHCGDNVSQADRVLPEYKQLSSIFLSLLRPCVPLFVMLTGYLLLPIKQMDLSTFYKKRIGRVAIPFVIWVVIHSLFGWGISLFGGDLDTVKGFFAWADADPSQTLSASLMRVVYGLRNFGTYTTHMWYLYVVIGLYLYMPIFSAWVKQATNKDKWLFATIWGATLFIPYIKAFVPSLPYPEQIYVWGGCAWNEFHMLYAFAGFNGYLLLGHLLGTLKMWSWMKTLAFSIPAYALGFWVTLTGFRSMLNRPNATEAQIELFFTYCSPNVLLMTAATWMLLRKIDWHNRILANLADCSFGIYLIHYTVLGPVYRLLEALALPKLVHLTVSSFVVLGITWGIIALLRCTPWSYALTGAARQK